MSDIMATPKPFDPELHDPALSAAYRDASATDKTSGPSAAIDDAIRAAARRAVGARPQPVRPSWTKRAAIPFALAATVVLAVGVGLRLYEFDDMTVQHTRERLPMADQTPATAAKPAEVAKAEPPRAAPAPMEQKIEQLAEAKPAAPIIAQGAAQPPASAPAAGDISLSRDTSNTASAAKPAAQAPPSAAAPPAIAPPAPRLEAAESERRQAKVGTAETQDAVTARTPAVGAASAPASPAPTFSADPPAGPAAKEELRKDRAATAGRLRAESPSPALNTPDALVLRIREHLRENRPDEAKRLLAELRERHPQFTLPEDLKALVPPQ